MTAIDSNRSLQEISDDFILIDNNMKQTNSYFMGLLP